MNCEIKFGVLTSEQLAKVLHALSDLELDSPLITINVAPGTDPDKLAEKLAENEIRARATVEKPAE